MNATARWRYRSTFLIALVCLALPLAWSQTVPPYTTDFEAADGATLGNLQGQDGWQVAQGGASVVNTLAASGTNSVLLVQGSPATQITHTFAALGAADVVYTDFYTLPNANQDINQSTLIDTESSRVGLVRIDNAGQVLVFDGNGTGGGHWVITGHTLALDASGEATNWTRFTIRQDYAAKKWDAYVDGTLVAYDLGFRDDTKTYMSSFKLTAATSTDSRFDDFYLGAGNPMFTDVDNDGLEDTWESAHGLNPALNDRAADLDGDGLSNVAEAALGTDPNNADTDGDGIPDGWEVMHGANPLVNDAASDPGEVGRTLLQSYQQGLSPWPTPTIADGLRTWLRADKGITKDGTNKVSGWLDMSGHVLAFFQTEASWQPTYTAAAMNGQPVVQYDDTHQILLTSGLADVLGGSNDATVIAVVKPDATANYAGTIFYWDTDGNWNMGLTAYGASNQYQLVWRDGDGNTQLSPALNAAAGTVQVLTAIKSGLTSVAYINGAIQGSEEVLAAMNLHPSKLAVGNSAFPYHAFHGQIAEVLVYDRALTDTERASVEAALMARYINPDADGDGLPDTWEDQFLGTRDYGANDDPGGVGRTLLQSYQQGLSPWPAPIVADDLRAWYRADLGITKDGDNKVSQWADLSGHGFHVVQVTDPSRQPLLMSAAMNGQPVVQYDDSQKALVTPGPTDVAAGANDATVIAVVKPESTANYAGTIFYWDTDGNWNMGLTAYGASNQYQLVWRDGDGNTQLSPALNAAAGAVQILTAVKGGATATAYINGMIQGSGEVLAAMNLHPSRLAVGNAASPYSAFHGQIAEVLVYNRALTDTERQSIEAALATKYINPDADGDGLPDTWEDQFLGTRDYGANDDPGGVGRTLLQSYQQGLSPWPAPIVADDLRAWYRADLGITKDGDNKVSQWADLSGHGFHVVQVTDPSRQPLLMSAAMNGQPVVQYDDSQKALVTPGPTDVAAGANDATVIAVVKPESTANYAGTIFYWDTDGNWNMGLTAYGASNQYQLVWRDGDGNTQLSPALNAAAGAVQILTAVKGGATATAYINGMIQGSGEVLAAMNLHPSRLAVGNAASPYSAFHGQIAEVLVYNRALTDTERQSIETALATKYINPDADGDGLPDTWEDQFLGTRDYGASDDPGGLGRTLLQSYQQGLSPWPAPTVSSGLRAWYRADAGVVKDSDHKVSQWTDVSGHGFHVVQVNDPDRQPLLVSAAMNGQAAVQYDDSQKALVTPGLADVAAGANDATVIAVVKPQDPANYAGTIFYWDTDGNWNMGLTAYGASNQYQLVWRDGAGNTQLSPALNASTGAVQILTTHKNGTTATAYINGTSQGSSEVPATMNLHPSRLAVGNAASPYSAFHGQIAEVLVYNRALTDIERQSIETALTAKYITGNSDGDSDHNGLPDTWESRYFGHTGVNPSADSDGDGVTNAQEYTAGTNPVDFYNGRAFALNTISASPTTVTYTYDASGRVTLADYGAGRTIQFTHSAASNLTDVASSGIAAGSTDSIVDWRTAHGLPADGTGDGSDTAILAGDGLPNLVKYGFGLDPHTAAVGDFPVVTLTSATGSDYLTLAYSRPEPAASDLTYRVEVSSDNGATWTSGTGATVDVSTTITGGKATVIVRDATAVGSPTLGRRIRLMIERRISL